MFCGGFAWLNAVQNMSGERQWKRKEIECISEYWSEMGRRSLGKRESLDSLTTCEISLRACLHGGGGPQVGEVTRLGGVTRLFIQSLILTWSRLHVRWGNPPHVTSPTWGPPSSFKQALTRSCCNLSALIKREISPVFWNRSFVQ